MLRVHPAARKHGISDDDIAHAVQHAIAVKALDDDRRLYLGPARSSAPLEVVTVISAEGWELAIHAMKMRAKYDRLLGS